MATNRKSKRNFAFGGLSKQIAAQVKGGMADAAVMPNNPPQPMRAAPMPGPAPVPDSPSEPMLRSSMKPEPVINADGRRQDLDFRPAPAKNLQGLGGKIAAQVKPAVERLRKEYGDVPLKDLPGKVMSKMQPVIDRVRQSKGDGKMYVQDNPTNYDPTAAKRLRSIPAGPQQLDSRNTPNLPPVTAAMTAKSAAVTPKPMPMSPQAKIQATRGNVGMAAGPMPGAASSAAKRTPPSLYGTPMSGGMKKGGSVSSASKRGDGIASRGKTRGKMV